MCPRSTLALRGAKTKHATGKNFKTRSIAQ
jgi:hypothetical protein